MAGASEQRRILAPARGGFELPAAWITGTVVLLAAGKLERLALTYHGKYEALTDTNYMVAHERYALGIAAMFAIFAIVYWAVPRFAGYGVSRALGWTHFALAFGGALLMFGTMEVLYFTLPPQRFSDASFVAANTVSMIGGYMMLAGFAVFIIAIAEAWVRKRPRAGAQT